MTAGRERGESGDARPDSEDARIDPAEVRRIAGLARLDLADEEVERLSREMARILGHFRELEEAETARGSSAGAGDLGELEGRGLEPRTGPDVPGPDPLRVPPGEMAPDWRDGFFVVPGLPGLAEEP